MNAQYKIGVDIFFSENNIQYLGTIRAFENELLLISYFDDKDNLCRKYFKEEDIKIKYLVKFLEEKYNIASAPGRLVKLSTLRECRTMEEGRKDTGEFVRQLIANLEKSFTLDDFDKQNQEIILENGGIGKIEVWGVSRPVIYTKSPTVRIRSEKRNRDIMDALCTKNERFSEDQELRIIFIQRINNIPLSIIDRPKYIPAPTGLDIRHSKDLVHNDSPCE